MIPNVSCNVLGFVVLNNNNPILNYKHNPNHLLCFSNTF